jgi:hypothetical protein
MAAGQFDERVFQRRPFRLNIQRFDAVLGQGLNYGVDELPGPLSRL